MALQVLIELVLGNVGKHFIVDLVCRAVGYPERQNETSCPGHRVRGGSTNPPLRCRRVSAQGQQGGQRATGTLPGFTELLPKAEESMRLD